MNYHYSLPLYTLIFLAAHHTHSMEQTFQTNLNLLQQSINLLVTQSNIDPQVAQDILNTTNSLNAQAQANMQQNINDIHVSTALNSLLETGNAILTETGTILPTALIDNLKYSARINAIHALLLATLSQNEANDPYYTDPYTETIGFTLNDYCVNQLFQALGATPIGIALNSLMSNSFNTLFNTPTTPAPIAALLPRITAGIIAHCAWTLEKKYLMPNKNKLRNKKSIQ